MSECREALSRRTWLGRFLTSGILATFGVLTWPVARFLKPKKGSAPGAREVVAPYKVHELRPDGQGAWPPPFEFGGRPCLVLRTKEGEVRAFDAVCTHVECTVAYRPEKGDIFCNCHNGVYDTSGRNVSGPPPRPLVAHKVTLRGKPGQEEIIVTRSS